jgi:hypothetical protein
MTLETNSVATVVSVLAFQMLVVVEGIGNSRKAIVVVANKVGGTVIRETTALAPLRLAGGITVTLYAPGVTLNLASPSKSVVPEESDG